MTLGAIIIYQLNALIYRPAEGTSENALLSATSGHISAEGIDGITTTRPLMYAKGIFFLSDIHLDGTYRLPSKRVADEKALLTLYRRDFWEEMEEEFVVNQTPKTRAKRKRTQQTNVSSDDDEEDSSVEGEMFEVEVVVPGDAGGLGDLPTAEHEIRVPSAEGLKRKVNRVTNQFSQDVFKHAPVPSKSGEKGWLVDSFDVDGANAGSFKEMSFYQVLSSCRYRFVGGTAWETVIFPSYFPEQADCKLALPRQHFSQAVYYQIWLKLMCKATEEDANTLKKTALQWFKTLKWLPYPEADRMWQTKTGTPKVWIGIGLTAPQSRCPRIAVNKNACTVGDLSDLENNQML